MRACRQPREPADSMTWFTRAYALALSRARPPNSHGAPGRRGADHVSFGVCLLDEELLQLAIRRAVQQDAFGRFAISTSATGLLVVLLEAPRKVVVDDPADVREVHSHAEGRGSHDCLQAARGEAFVHHLTCVAVDGAVVRGDRDTHAGEQFGDLVGGAPAAAVHECPAPAGSDEIEECLALVSNAATADDRHRGVLAPGTRDT